jgi:sulfite reductase alpha subunit-like flavoprotein
MYEYVQRPRRTILEVLLDFRHTKVPKEYIFDLFPLMRPREFSIASSIKVRSTPTRCLRPSLTHAEQKHPKSIQLCMAIVKYKTNLKHARKGLCTTWLAGLEPSMGKKFRVGIHRGLLSLPPTLETPVVCIGPGTGIAPMRCMIQERTVDGAHSVSLYMCPMTAES